MNEINKLFGYISKKFHFFGMGKPFRKFVQAFEARTSCVLQVCFFPGMSSLWL